MKKALLLGAALLLAGTAAATAQDYHNQDDRSQGYQNQGNYDHGQGNQGQGNQGFNNQDRDNHDQGHYDRGPDGGRVDDHGPRPGEHPGPHHWQHGDHLPPEYWHHGHEIDWRQHHLRRPPHGYHWVQTDDQYALVGITTGLVNAVIDIR